MDYKNMTSKQLVKMVVAHHIEQQELEQQVQNIKDTKKEIFNELRERGIDTLSCANGSIKWKEGYERVGLDQNMVKTYLTSEQQKACEKITNVAGLYMVNANKKVSVK